MNSTDRMIRVILALVFGGLYFTNVVSGKLGLILVVLGVVFLATSLIGFCPLYTLLGLKTKKE